MKVFTSIQTSLTHLKAVVVGVRKFNVSLRQRLFKTANHGLDFKKRIWNASIKFNSLQG